jgi:hypothetical protein
MKKKFLLAAFATILFSGLITFVFVDEVTEPSSLRNPASGPANYDSLTACDKQEVLWEKIAHTAYAGELPEMRKFGLFQLMSLAKQEIAPKGKMRSDFSPRGWKKLLHGRGAIAKVKLVPVNSNYTGIFQGADCGLLRLSLTFQPSKRRAVAPGLALKILRDSAPSANVSALVSLGGQEDNYNFFANAMSNIVPIGDEFGQRMVHRIFKKESKFPEQLLVQEMATVDARGTNLVEVNSPVQIFFIPGENLNFPSEPHDVREDFLKIPEGTLVYQVHAATPKLKNFNYDNYTENNKEEFIKESVHIANLITTSEFIASEFGDDGIFFRHQLR